MMAALWQGIVFICAGLGLALISGADATKLVKHDASFNPDIVLRVSSENIILDSGQPRLSTLVNGSYPGPPIYLEPEKMTWIRVYNDADVNTTIVSPTPAAIGRTLMTETYSTGTACPYRRPHLRMDPHWPRSGRYHRDGSSTTRYALRPTRPGPHSITHTWGFRPPPRLAR